MQRDYTIIFCPSARSENNVLFCTKTFHELSLKIGKSFNNYKPITNKSKWYKYFHCKWEFDWWSHCKKWSACSITHLRAHHDFYLFHASLLGTFCCWWCCLPSQGWWWLWPMDWSPGNFSEAFTSRWATKKTPLVCMGNTNRSVR